MNKNRIALPLLVLTAVVALVVGSMGTATAAGLTVGKVRKIAAQVVNQKAPTLSVAHATTADKATTAEKATTADKATTANTANTATTATTATSANTANTATTANGVANGAISSPGAFGSGNLGIVRAFAWNNSASADATLSGNGYTYNRSGGAVTVTHNSAGNYTVTFAGLSLNGGNYQVTGYGGGAVWCKVSSWGGSSVGVLCYNSAGAATDSLFTIAAIQ